MYIYILQQKCCLTEINNKTKMAKKRKKYKLNVNKKEKKLYNY